jgi:hypothetical protein
LPPALFQGTEFPCAPAPNFISYGGTGK